MNNGEIKTKAKKFLAVNAYHPLTLYVLSLAMMLIFAVLIIACLQVPALVAFIIIVAVLVYFILLSAIEYSSAEFYLRSYNLKTGENFSFFEGFKRENFWRSILLRLIKTGLGLVLLIAGIAPGIIFIMRTSFAHYLMRDDTRLSAVDAMRQSNELVKGHTKQYFSLICTFIGWFALGIVSAGGVMIYALPYFQTAKSIFYRNELMGIDDDALSDMVQSRTAAGASAGAAVSDEINDIDKRIAEMERQKAEIVARRNQTVFKTNQLNSKGVLPDNIAFSTPLQDPAYQAQTTPAAHTNTAASNPASNPAPTVNPLSNPAPAAASVTETAVAEPEEKLVLENISEFTDIIKEEEPIVEEIPLPKETPAFSQEPQRSPSNDEVFISKEVEIMENETFEDFRTRVERLRKEREEELRLEKASGASRRSAASAKSDDTTDKQELKKLSRSELIEKLRKDREKKGK